MEVSFISQLSYSVLMVQYLTLYPFDADLIQNRKIDDPLDVSSPKMELIGRGTKYFLEVGEDKL